AQARVDHLIARVAKRSGNDNLMPYILDAVRAYATEGEIMQSLIEVFGTYTETAVV
ncbi:MAG TPA: methylmalonyl-CoA mutase family protein, partial [Candidatus Dormibacteraeota bacterium]|nr:methylmalonyl-CoA mutase family protein [Candidatus Dormibacteraeota bacterium]